MQGTNPKSLLYSGLGEVLEFQSLGGVRHVVDKPTQSLVTPKISRMNLGMTFDTKLENRLQAPRHRLRNANKSNRNLRTRSAVIVTNGERRDGRR